METVGQDAARDGWEPPLSQTIVEAVARVRRCRVQTPDMLDIMGVAAKDSSTVKYYFRCPKCGNDEQFVKPSEEASGLGCALLLCGGFIPYLLFASDRQGRIQCTNCAHIFRQPPLPMSGLAKFAGWMIALAVIPVLVAVLFFSLADPAAVLPSLPVIATIESAIAAQPRVAAYLFVTMVVLIVISSWAAVCVSNVRYRKQLSGEYRLKPLSSREFAEQNESRRDASMEDRAALVRDRDNAIMERGDAMRDWDA